MEINSRYLLKSPANETLFFVQGKCHTFCCGFEFLSEALGSTEDEVLSQVAFENISKLYKAGIILARKPEPRNAKRVKEVSFMIL